MVERKSWPSRSYVVVVYKVVMGKDADCMLTELDEKVNVEMDIKVGRND